MIHMNTGVCDSITGRLRRAVRTAYSGCDPHLSRRENLPANLSTQTKLDWGWCRVESGAMGHGQDPFRLGVKSACDSASWQDVPSCCRVGRVTGNCSAVRSIAYGFLQGCVLRWVKCRRHTSVCLCASRPGRTLLLFCLLLLGPTTTTLRLPPFSTRPLVFLLQAEWQAPSHSLEEQRSENPATLRYTKVACNNRKTGQSWGPLCIRWF